MEPIPYFPSEEDTKRCVYALVNLLDALKRAKRMGGVSLSDIYSELDRVKERCALSDRDVSEIRKMVDEYYNIAQKYRSSNEEAQRLSRELHRELIFRSIKGLLSWPFRP